MHLEFGEISDKCAANIIRTIHTNPIIKHSLEILRLIIPDYILDDITHKYTIFKGNEDCGDESLRQLQHYLAKPRQYRRNKKLYNNSDYYFKYSNDNNNNINGSNSNNADSNDDSEETLEPIAYENDDESMIEMLDRYENLEKSKAMIPLKELHLSIYFGIKPNNFTLLIRNINFSQMLSLKKFYLSKIQKSNEILNSISQFLMYNCTFTHSVFIRFISQHDFENIMKFNSLNKHNNNKRNGISNAVSPTTFNETIKHVIETLSKQQTDDGSNNEPRISFDNLQRYKSMKLEFEERLMESLEIEKKKKRDRLGIDLGNGDGNNNNSGSNSNNNSSNSTPETGNYNEITEYYMSNDFKEDSMLKISEALIYNQFCYELFWEEVPKILSKYGGLNIKISNIIRKYIYERETYAVWAKTKEHVPYGKYSFLDVTFVGLPVQRAIYYKSMKLFKIKYLKTCNLRRCRRRLAWILKESMKSKPNNVSRKQSPGASANGNTSTNTNDNKDRKQDTNHNKSNSGSSKAKSIISKGKLQAKLKIEYLSKSTLNLSRSSSPRSVSPRSSNSKEPTPVNGHP